MTDDSYYKDLKEKSVTARSAHKAYSRLRRGARLPSDKLTRKEWEKMNGPVHSFNLNAPMDYETFKSMPQNLREQYIRQIVDKYKVGPGAVCQMFGLNNKTGVGSHMFRKLGIKAPKKIPRAAVERFLREFGKRKETAVASAETVMLGATFDFTCHYSPETIADSIRGLFPAGSKVNVRIEIRAAD